MPFKPEIFQENIEHLVKRSVRQELVEACEKYAALTAPGQKAHCIHEMMSAMDRELDEKTRCGIMEACGRRCIGPSILDTALRLKRKESDLDSLLDSLNKAHIGGGHLHRENETIFARYDRCYCGSVSKTKIPFSGTFCHCSCGWLKQLFETLLGEQAEVKLLRSIIQGDACCEFSVEILPSGNVDTDSQCHPET